MELPSLAALRLGRTGVSGVAALMLAQQNVYGQYDSRNLAPEDVEFLLQKYAHDKGATGYDDASGWGLLDAGNVMQHLDYPMYRVFHSDIPATRTVSSTPASVTLNLIANTNGISAGLYNADRYAVLESYSYTFPSSATIIDSWPRFSSSISLSAANPNDDETYFTFTPTISGTTLNVTAYSYAYYITSGYVSGQTINQWIPDETSNLKTAFSALIMDPNYSSIDEKQNELSRFFIYPNPATDEFEFTYSLLTPSNVSLNILDLTGKLILTTDLGYKLTGSYSSSIGIDNLSSGVYLVKLIAGGETFQRKMIKISN